MKYKIRKELFSFSCLKPPIASVHMVGWLGLKMKRAARCTALMQWKKPPSVRMPETRIKLMQNGFADLPNK